MTGSFRPAFPSPSDLGGALNDALLRPVERGGSSKVSSWAHRLFADVVTKRFGV